MRSIFLLLVFFLLVDLTYAQEVQVSIKNLENDKGQIVLLLFQKDQDFGLNEVPFKEMTIGEISNNKAIFSILAIPKGEYAFLVFHDEDNDGIFATNWIGMPKEGVGKSGEQNTRPTYENSKFFFDGTKLVLEVIMKYIF